MNHVSELSQAELCLLAGLRIWVDRIKYHQAGLPYLLDHFSDFNVSDAAYSLDAVLNNTGASAIRPVEIYRPNYPHLSADEAGFLYAVACLQILYLEPAKELLNSWMPATAVRLTLEPLQGLARILQLTDIILPLRQGNFMTLAQNDKTTPCTILH